MMSVIPMDHIVRLRLCLMGPAKQINLIELNLGSGIGVILVAAGHN
jgi:hypothetical protein